MITKNDILDEFFAEYCQRNALARCPASDLFKAFSEFLANRYPSVQVTQTRFGRDLRAYGLEKRRGSGGYAYLGIQLT